MLLVDRLKAALRRINLDESRHEWLDDATMRVLEQLDIRVLRYHWSGNKVSFENLNEVLK